MIVTPQHSNAILECDHLLSEREIRRIKADLQAIGIAAVILPMGVSVAGMATCGLEDEDDG